MPPRSCDLITLLSVRTASKGGHSRIASATAIHDAMLERAPELVPLLYCAPPLPLLAPCGLGLASAQRLAPPSRALTHTPPLASSRAAAPIERIWEGGSGVIALPIWATHPETGRFTTQISPS